MEDSGHDQSSSEETSNHSEVVERIVQSLREGKKIDAIKDYRESTGAGLKESNEAIEVLIQKYNITMKSGCASMFLVALSTTALIFISLG